MKFQFWEPKFTQFVLLASSDYGRSVAYSYVPLKKYEPGMQFIKGAVIFFPIYGNKLSILYKYSDIITVTTIQLVYHKHIWLFSSLGVFYSSLINFC